MFKKQSKAKRGFTLLEMVVVVAIVVLLAVVAAPMAIQQVDKARVAKVVSEVSSIQSAVSLYRQDVGSYPDSDSKLISDTARGWDGPYINKVPTNHPYGTFTYALNGSEPTLTITFTGGDDKVKQAIWEALGGSGSVDTGKDIVVNLRTSVPSQQ
ncbi:MAG: type II secretion system protein GspG [Candidatus Anstonellales archaeon]